MARVYVLALIAVLASGCGGDDSPEVARADSVASHLEQAGLDTTEPYLTAYFLKFSSNDQVDQASRDLREQGFAVNDPYGAELGLGWLVVEKMTAVSVDLADNEELLNDVAAEHGGRYDGWESAIWSARNE